MREFSADRPDKTESAYTVDAGHFQVEMDLVSYTYDRDQSGGGDTRTEAWAIAPVNLKVGLFNDLDVQLVLETYNRIRTEDRVAGTTQHQSGFGDATLRWKKNFWGNDGGKTAFAMMPFVKFPANQDNLGNHAVEGGLIFPFSMGLPRGWNLGVMTEVDFLRNDARAVGASATHMIPRRLQLWLRMGPALMISVFFGWTWPQQGSNSPSHMPPPCCARDESSAKRNSPMRHSRWRSRGRYRARQA